MFVWNQTRKNENINVTQASGIHAARYVKKLSVYRSNINNSANRPYFGEVADDVRSLFVDFSEDVEDEGLHVKIKRLVVEK